MHLEAQIEAILFYKAEPVTFRELALVLEKNEMEIKEALEVLSSALQKRGIQLLQSDIEAELRTHPEASSFIEKMAKEEIDKELSRPALETLSIILYQGPILRKDIDFVRGVNSSFILRTLSARGLIQKNNKNEYSTTLDLLAHLGIKNPAELPEYESLHDRTE